MARVCVYLATLSFPHTMFCLWLSSKSPLLFVFKESIFSSMPCLNQMFPCLVIVFILAMSHLHSAFYLSTQAFLISSSREDCCLNTSFYCFIWCCITAYRDYSIQPWAVIIERPHLWFVFQWSAFLHHQYAAWAEVTSIVSSQTIPTHLVKAV